MSKCKISEPAGLISRASRSCHCILDALDTVSQMTAREYGGRIDFNQGDAYYFSFAEASKALAGAECFARNWEEIRRKKQISCAINIGLNRGTIYAYRSSFATRFSSIVRRGCRLVPQECRPPSASCAALSTSKCWTSHLRRRDRSQVSVGCAACQSGMKVRPTNRGCATANSRWSRLLRV